MDGLWQFVTAETPFGLIRGLVRDGRVGLSSMKALSSEEFLQWGRRRLGEGARIETADEDSMAATTFRADVARLLDGDSAQLRADLSRNTKFQVQVAEAVSDIPYGQTASYGDVAVAVGNPKAAQAVGQALPTLPFGLFIPSHRVVRSTGESVGCTLLTFDLKTGLLQWERRRAAAAARKNAGGKE